MSQPERRRTGVRLQRRGGVWTVDRTDMGCRGCQRNIGHVDIGREKERKRVSGNERERATFASSLLGSCFSVVFPQPRRRHVCVCACACVSACACRYVCVCMSVCLLCICLCAYMRLSEALLYARLLVCAPSSLLYSLSAACVSLSVFAYVRVSTRWRSPSTSAATSLLHAQIRCSLYSPKPDANGNRWRLGCGFCHQLRPGQVQEQELTGIMEFLF